MAQWVFALVLCSCITVSAKSYTQEKISLHLENAKIKNALSSLQKETMVKLLYSERLLPDNQKIFISADERPFREVLSQILFGTGLTYKVIDSNLVAIVPIPSDYYYEVVIRGTVIDESGKPLEGVTIVEKGTTNGTTTDSLGIFKLSVKDQNAVLVVSRVGFERTEVTVGNQAFLQVALKVAPIALDSVVVVGYGQQKRVNLTGAISTVKGGDISWRPVGQVSTALQGVMPGVTVTTSTGQPGLDKGTIRIRGVGTLNNNDALVLVDGVQFSDINAVDANDIASISVLKDAAASAIYGVKAANGVILITTKRGASGKPKVSYSDYFGWQNPARLSKYVGAQEYMKLVNLMYQNSGGSAQFTDTQIAAYNDPNRNKDQYADNYWLKDVLTGSGFQQNHSLSIGGGNEDVKYHFSAGYFDQAGLVHNMDYNRITVRLNTDIKISSKINFSADIAANLGDRTEPQGVSGSAWYQFGQAAIINPTVVNKYSDGTWNIVRGGQNPIRLQDEGGIYSYKNNLFTGNFKGVYKPITGLAVTGMASVNYNSTYNSLHDKALDYFTDFPDNTNTLTIGTNQVTKEWTGYWFRNFQGLVEYGKDFGQHSFKILGGFSRLSEHNDELQGYRKNLASGDLQELDAGAADGQTATGTANEYVLLSYFGRLNYSFKDRYLFEANVRRDGSSRFPDGQKWGVFPSFSAGWRISQENFMKGVSFIDDLKIRASWGKLGNDAIGNYPYQSAYISHSYPFGGTLNPTSGLETYPNSGLTWETTKMLDAGLDAHLFNHFGVTFDYYKKNTDNILMQLSIPYIVGLAPSYQNAGKVQNTGWELAVNYNGKIGNDFAYAIGANLSDVKNKIIDLKQTDLVSKDNNNIYTGNVTGNPIGGFYGYQVEGIYQTAAQVAAHATQPFSGTGLGDLIYKDQDGDQVVKEGYKNAGGDMVYLGSNIPRYTYGFNLGASYKNFDLSAVFQGVAKVNISTLVIERAPYSPDGNFKAIHEDSWTPENTDAAFPRLLTDVRNYQSSSFWIKSGAYLRLKSAQLGYTLPKQLLAKAGISRFRIYASGQNLFTFSHLPKDIDPESPNDSRYYPQVKTYTFGVNLEF